MTIINTMFGPLQISRVGFGKKGFVFKKPPAWALKPGAGSVAQEEHKAHLAAIMNGCTQNNLNIRGKITYPKTGENIPFAAVYAAVMRFAGTATLGKKGAELAEAEKAKAVLYKGAANLLAAKKNSAAAIKAAIAAAQAAEPKTVSMLKEEKEALKKSLSFISAYKKIPAVASAAVATEARDDWADSDFDIGTFF